MMFNNLTAHTKRRGSDVHTTYIHTHIRYKHNIFTLAVYSQFPDAIYYIAGNIGRSSSCVCAMLSITTLQCAYSVWWLWEWTVLSEFLKWTKWRFIESGDATLTDPLERNRNICIWSVKHKKSVKGIILDTLYVYWMDVGRLMCSLALMCRTSIHTGKWCGLV